MTVVCLGQLISSFHQYQISCVNAPLNDLLINLFISSLIHEDQCLSDCLKGRGKKNEKGILRALMLGFLYYRGTLQSRFSHV